MRSLRIPAAFLLLTALVVGCSDQPVPTGLSDSPAAAAVSSDAADAAVPLFRAAAASPTINTSFNNLAGRSVTGRATARCVTQGTQITVHLSGLRPKGVYTVWLFTYMPPGFDGTQTFRDGVGSLGANDGSQNSFQASASGQGQLSVIMPAGDLSSFGSAGPCLPVDEAVGFHFVVFFHTDGMTHGPVPGPGFAEGGFIMA